MKEESERERGTYGEVGGSLLQILEAACESAMKRVIGITGVSLRRLMSPRESAGYLALSEREIYNMVSSQQLTGVRHGRRLMIDVRDLDQWIAAHKQKLTGEQVDPNVTH